ncbi:hypothetical protein ACOSQ3_007250 [Xanthoceras sorbifolium]
MDWCGSSTPRTPEYRTMNEERHARKAYWLVIVRPQFLTGGTRVSRKQKISILVLSSAMGSNLREILENICYPEIFLSFLTDKEKKKLGQKKMPFWSFINNLLV